MTMWTNGMTHLRHEMTFGRELRVGSPLHGRLGNFTKSAIHEICLPHLLNQSCTSIFKK